MFEQFPSQTEWTQDLGQLLLGGGSISVSPPPPFIAEVHELLATLPSPTLPAAFPSPVLPAGPPGTEATPTSAQEIVLSLPSPASLNALAEHFFDCSEHRTCTPTAPSAPSLLGSGYATAEGSPDLGVEPYLPPDVAFGSTALFDWATLAGAILPPHAEPSLITDHNDDGVPDQTERSESFELVSPPSISAFNDNEGGNDHVDAHAWWTDFASLAPRFSAPQPDSQCTLELEEDQGQEQEQLLVVDLSDATPPQVQIDMVKVHAEVVDQLAEAIQVQITGQAPEIPLDPVQPEYLVHIKPSNPEPNLEPSLPLPPPVVPQDLSPVASQRLSSFSPPFQHSSHQHALEKYPCVSLPIKGRERKRKAVVINEDTVHGVDGDGNGDAKAAQKRPVKRRKSESADAKPRTRKKKGVRVGETTKVTSSDDPIRERMVVTTDEKGELKMIPLRTRAKQHDHQVGSSANANLQPSQAHLPLPQVEVPSPPPRPPQAKPMVPRRILPHPDTSHPLVSSASQPLAGRIQDPSNTLLEPRVPTVPAVPVVSTSVLQHGTPRSLLANPHPPSHSVSSLPARASAPCPTSPVGSIVAPLPRYAASYNHVESWNGGFTDMELESEAQLLSALPPPIRRYPAQNYTFGTGIVDMHGQIDVGQGASTLAQYQQQATPVYAECSFARDSMHVSVPAQTYRYHQHKPASASASAPAPASATASLSYSHVEIPQCRYYPLGAQQQIQPAVRQTQPMQHTQALQESLMYAVPLIESYSHHQHQHQRHQRQPSFHTHDFHQGHLHPAPYSHPHPEQMPVEPLYPSQYAHDPYISGYNYSYV